MMSMKKTTKVTILLEFPDANLARKLYLNLNSPKLRTFRRLKMYVAFVRIFNPLKVLN